jgi:hypothetical protein
MPIQRLAQLEEFEFEDKISKPTPCKEKYQPSSIGSDEFQTAMSTSPPR